MTSHDPDAPQEGRFVGRDHRFPVRVYFEDTDFSGVVYHANYLRWFERARSDMLRLLGIDQRAAQEAVLWGLLAVDKRQGYRGPVMQLATKAEQDKFIEKSKKVLGSAEIEPGRYYVGLVSSLSKDSLTADVTIGSKVAKLQSTDRVCNVSTPSLLCSLFNIDVTT
jgi:hypothetical protein